MESCPLKYALDALAGKWKLYIVYILSINEQIRFNELQRQVGNISATMLSKNLQELEEANIINRYEYKEIPPHVEYSLSEIGKQLIPALESLEEWGHKLYVLNEA